MRKDKMPGRGRAGHRVGRAAARMALCGMAVVALAASGACGSDSDSSSGPATTDGRDGVEIEGVKTFDDLDQNHVSGTVDYPQTPPVGGDHASVWQNCGFYSSPIITEQGVHSMEHGAVWITFDPALPADQVEVLRKLARVTYVLVSPFPGLPSPVVATSWGTQLQLPSAVDPRLDLFVTKYRQGPNTPEPNAPCTGAAGRPG